MKSTDWRWNGRGRRQGYWHMTKGPFHFDTAESPRWCLNLWRLHIRWWPNDRFHLDIGVR